MDNKTNISFVAEAFKDKIIDYFHRKGVVFKLDPPEINKLEFKYRICFKKRTEIRKIRQYARDAQLYLKVERFDIVENDSSAYIVLSIFVPRNNNLLNIFSSKEYLEAANSMAIAHPLGLDQSGKPIIADLKKYPHLLVAGASNSGKTVSLKCLLISLTMFYTPQKLKLLVADGAEDLNQFADLPHLSHPLIKDFETFFTVMLILKDEMERRLCIKNKPEFEKNSEIVCVIDEFSSFIAGTNDKKKIDLLTETLNEILRRGRHARIHIVLAAHNPTRLNVKIDTCDIPARMIFRVANNFNSRTAMGVGGAEKLKGNGDMFFSMNGEIQHLQGFFISDEKIKANLSKIRKRYNPRQTVSFDQVLRNIHSVLSSTPNFYITDEDLSRKKSELMGSSSIIDTTKAIAISQNNDDDAFFAKVAFWALQQDSISSNRIIEEFNIGWRKAKKIIDRLHEMVIVDDLESKLPRNILPKSIEDLPIELINILKLNGYSDADINNIFTNKITN